MSIELKSTGFLIDELLTTELKMEHFEGLQERYNDLNLAISKRITRQNLDEPNSHTLSILTLNLKQIIGDCWNAQELVMKSEEIIIIATAAKQAQKLNIKRNTLIRQIDELLNEVQYSPLRKSYA